MQNRSSDSRDRLPVRTARLLDASRAIAALAVVLSHGRTLLLVEPDRVVHPTPTTAILYWLTGFGHQAVVIFFVLSGALVGGSVARSVSGDAWSWGDYLIRRLSRLYVVLIPALILIVVWDSAGRMAFPAHALYYADVMSNITVAGHTFLIHNQGALAFAGNAAFLMTIYVPVLGSGGALWSLSNEFWYYILFPCMALAVALRRDSLKSLVYVAVATVICLLVGREIVEWMAVWLLGTAAVSARRFRISASLTRRLCTVTFVLFVVTLAVERTVMNVVSLSGDLAIGASFALFLYCVFCRGAAEDPATVATGPDRSAATWKRLAGFSYTLYLFHQPPLAFANAWLSYTHHALWQPTALHVALMFAVVLAIVLYAYAGSLLTEAHTDDLRRFASRLFHPVPASRSPVPV